MATVNITTEKLAGSNGHSSRGSSEKAKTSYQPVLIPPSKVHETLNQHMLADGFDLIVDLKNSKGSWIEDSRSGKRYLDFFTFFGSSPIGLNHPKMFEPSFVEALMRAAINKPSSSDAYTVEMAEFVETFARLAMPEYLPHAFFIEGGALAVENALKTAFDWKVRKNFTRGYTTERGRMVMHFRYAFHGRSGYTMSLTNTDPVKTMYFPKFKDWPRIDSPFLHFPRTPENIERSKKEEAIAIQQMKDAFINNPDDVAAIILEPIQAEGGDHHFSLEFMQALRELADENETMLIFDEVQTGIGLTGKMWAHKHFVQPDIMSFGKKTQVCGMLASRRVDEAYDNVFVRASRINSTWGGNLVDMLRFKRYLEIIYEDNLVENARIQGDFLLGEVIKLQDEFPQLVFEARGRGLMCAFDLAEAQMRDLLKQKCYEEGLILIGAGDRSIRFRPPLTITRDELAIGINIIREQLKELSIRDY